MPLTHQIENWILAVLIAVTVLFNADYTAVNVALVSMSKTFHVPIYYIQWVLSVYSLVWAMFSIPGGKLADYLGPEKTILTGGAIFGIASLLGGFAFSGWFLIAARMLQAVGAAICIPAFYSLIMFRISQPRQKSAFGLMAGGSALGLIIGPSLSGILIRLLSWRFVFFINIPFILFVFYVFLSKYNWRSQINKINSFDYFSLILFMLSIFGITLWLNQASHWGLISAKTIYVLGSAIILLICFLIFQGRKKSPIIRFSLFKIKPYLGSTLLYITEMFNFVFCLFIIGLYLQNIKNYSPYETGLIFLSFSGGFGIMSLITPKLLKRFSIFQVILSGALLTFVGFCLMGSLTQNSSFAAIILSLITMGIALGLMFPAFNTEMAISLPKPLVGEGSGLFIMFGLLFSSIFVVVSTALLNFWIQSKFYILMRFKISQLTVIQQKLIKKILAHTHMPIKSLTQAGIHNGASFVHSFQTGFIHAMHNLVIIGIVLVFINIGIILSTLRSSTICSK